MTYVIIPNAEIPNRRQGGPVEYPFADMQVGDGFDAPRDMGKNKAGSDKRQRDISARWIAWAKKNNPTAKFTVRMLDDATIRCVRTA